MTPEKKSIFIASMGGFDLNIPILHYGSGSPSLLIINNLHGNEISGFYILEKLLEKLPPLKGSLTIVTSANPLGAINKHRLLPFDFIDLNRGYPPANKERGINVVLKEKLIKLGLAHDIIVDLHTFVRPSLSAGLLLQQQSPVQQELVEKCIRVLGTETVIEINTALSEEKRVASALGSYLIEHGKTSFVIEYPPVSQLSTDSIEHYSEGLRRMLAVTGVSTESIDMSAYSMPRIFRRQQIISRNTGLFMPTRKLNDEIKINDMLGYILDIKTLGKEPLLSPYRGQLLELADRQMYIFGEKLATIGESVL